MGERGKQLSPAQREEMGFEAYELSQVKKWTYRQIAGKLGVDKNTVGPLIREEAAKRRLRYWDQIEESAATYDAVMRDAWERVEVFPYGQRSMVVVGLYNNILNARTRKDILLGLEAPRKADITQRIEHVDLSHLSDEELEELTRLDGRMRSIVSGVAAPSEN